MIDIAAQRLLNQQLNHSSFQDAEDIVRWLGAVQAQEYLGAKWGIAQRSASLTEADIDRAFAQGRILRTHVMRPTWHLVTPQDIRWMLALTSRRVNAANALYYRKLGLDEAVFARSNALLIKVLQGGNQLTRPELAIALQHGGIYETTHDRLRLIYLLMRAELDGVICSGALRGKQHTYALLDEQAPLIQPLERDEALAEFARRYFTSHGPATLKDFIWWSGLTPADARTGLELVKPQLIAQVVAGKTCWLSPKSPVKLSSPIAHLLPAFDEYTVAYQDRSPILDPQYKEQARASNGMVVLLDGHITGAWKRTVSKKTVMVEIRPFKAPTDAQGQAIQAAAERYGTFLGLPVVPIDINPPFPT
jgi:hypothetical protein